METFYFCIVIFLFVLAIFDLVVGVSNDAVNFLNSAVGAKAAPLKLVLSVAAIGIFAGACMSNGMMEIARHGIYQPQHFYFNEIMCILLAVMLTDVVLLDLFNTMGLPTSTTVSMVFELLGGTFAIALVKTYASDGLDLGTLINTEKALSVIMGIFLSVAIAFFFGMIVQYLARLIFTFNYKRNMHYFIGVFGGIATTSIVYFMLIKGLKDSTLMTPELNGWLKENTLLLISAFFVFFSILMQILYWLKVNVFKVVVLLGTFALALAFAGNDLVNFIGVPLAGYSSFLDFASQNGTVAHDSLLMTSLMGPAQTPWYFLIAAGAIMVVALCTSKKAHNVIKTSVNLSRQDEGEEGFGSTQAARVLVRGSLAMAQGVVKYTPENLKKWINSRFVKDEAIIEDGAAFDLVRASVNLVLAGLLIAVGTSLKLPLSTTYVTFMVAMGSSLSDRAWGRDSAVYRITGVLSVIGGWFLTAGAAFSICFLVALLIYWGGTTAIFILIALAVFTLIRSQLSYKKKAAKEENNDTFRRILLSTDDQEKLQLIRTYTLEEQDKVLEFALNNFTLITSSFMNENLRGLRKAKGAIKFEKQQIKQMKRQSTLAISKLSSNFLLEKGLYYYQGNDFLSEIVYSIGRYQEPCEEHIDNNFNPLEEIQKEDFNKIALEIEDFLAGARNGLSQTDIKQSEVIERGNQIINRLSQLKKEELKRLQENKASVKLSLLYLTMIQEAQNIVTYTINMIKVSRKFQLD